MAIAHRLRTSMSREGSARWTSTAVLLCGFLVGVVSSHPIPSRTNASALEDAWERLFSRSVLGLSGDRSELSWETDYLLGIKRVRRLYCNAVFQDECKFKETLLPNNYNAYESSVYKGFYIALSKHGRVKRGNKATTAMTVTHFLPRL
ncbi:Fibroblast growth factor 6-like [Scleropages formosus]|uniref:Fibroblast growth factor 6-like n=1 Tax=Scleropages formosus TaxID=113540 RepID=A0A0P7UZ43_SCLFO|nr:Fibroblast growth factor 6-like [Scleropages formosus]